MDKVLKHLTDIERKLGKIEKITAKGLSAMSLKEMIKMSRKRQSVTGSMKKTVKDFEGVTPTEAEAQAALALVKSITASNVEQMASTRASKPEMEKKHVAGLARKNMAKSEETGTQFYAVVVEKMPEGPLKEEAKTFAEGYQKAFTETLKLYSNATGGEDHDVEAVDDSD